MREGRSWKEEGEEEGDFFPALVFMASFFFLPLQFLPPSHDRRRNRSVNVQIGGEQHQRSHFNLDDFSFSFKKEEEGEDKFTYVVGFLKQLVVDPAGLPASRSPFMHYRRGTEQYGRVTGSFVPPRRREDKVGLATLDRSKYIYSGGVGSPKRLRRKERIEKKPSF